MSYHLMHFNLLLPFYHKVSQLYAFLNKNFKRTIPNINSTRINPNPNIYTRLTSYYFILFSSGAGNPPSKFLNFLNDSKPEIVGKKGFNIH